MISRWSYLRHVEILEARKCTICSRKNVQENWMEILGMFERGDIETYVQYLLY